jgi:N-acetylglucosamine-6-phosphate deacetylase
MLGIHLEGPFISSKDGAVGAHPVAYTVEPSIALFDELCALAEGQVAIMTVAPELAECIDLIRHAVSKGVVISIGHTLAESGHVLQAVAAGASLSTHLGNGCPNIIHRHSNPIWPQLANKKLSAMIISDGHHLPEEILSVIFAAKGQSSIIVTSDSSAVAGCPPGIYVVNGIRRVLEPSGRLRNLEKDTLAGSSATILHCMNILARVCELGEEEIWRIGRDNPLAVLKKDVSVLPLGNVRLVNNVAIIGETDK